MWTSPTCSSSVLLTPTQRHSDPSPFSLSAEQQAIFAGWKRPAEILAELGSGAPRQDDGSGTAAASAVDLVQDLATDCSVVASLCAAVRHLTSSEGSVSSAMRDREKASAFMLTCP